jgi:hypothetical protein
MNGSCRPVYDRPAENAYASGDIGRTYRGDDHRDNRRPSDQGRMGP